LAGESYAGVYIPTLTELILSNPNTPLYKQFQGFMAGNPCFFCSSANLLSDININVNIFYWHGLASYQNYFQWQQLGCPTNYNASVCQNLYKVICDQIGVIDQELLIQNSQYQPSLDPDDLYQDFCLGNGTLQFAENRGWPNCYDQCYNTTLYLNRPDVQQAIHARPTKWVVCTNNINYTSAFISMVPLYAKFPIMKPGVKILVYSGDVDIATVPFGFTQACLHELQRPTISAWQPWFVDTATAGYVEVFDTYSYATIKGAGHEAPQYQPNIAYHLAYRWITRQNLTDPEQDSRPKITLRTRLTQSKMLRDLIKKAKGR